MRYMEAERRAGTAEDREHALKQEVATLQASLAEAASKTAAQVAAAEQRGEQQAEARESAAVQETEKKQQEVTEKLQAALKVKEGELQVCLNEHAISLRTPTHFPLGGQKMELAIRVVSHALAPRKLFVV